VLPSILCIPYELELPKTPSVVCGVSLMSFVSFFRAQRSSLSLLFLFSFSSLSLLFSSLLYCSVSLLFAPDFKPYYRQSS